MYKMPPKKASIYGLHDTTEAANVSIFRQKAAAATSFILLMVSEELMHVSEALKVFLPFYLRSPENPRAGLWNEKPIIAASRHHSQGL